MAAKSLKKKHQEKKETTVNDVIAFLAVLQVKTDRKLKDIANICMDKNCNE